MELFTFIFNFQRQKTNYNILELMNKKTTGNNLRKHRDLGLNRRIRVYFQSRQI